MLVSQADDPLEATLRCVQPMAEQLVVMDCAESPRIAELCRQYAAQRITPSSELDLGAAWNEAMHEATGEWILCLEAGETLTADSIQSLQSFVRSEADSTAAYVLMIEIPAGTGQSCGEQSAQIRLIPGRAGLGFVGRVRPSLMLSAAHIGLDVRHLACKIQRGEREYNQRVRSTRAERDLQLAHRQLAEEGESAELFVAWGEALSGLGQHHAAAEYFRRALPMAERGSTVMLEAYYGLLSAMDTNPAAREAQLTTCLEALDIYPLDAQLLCGMGSYMLGQNRPDLAVRAYTIAVGHGQVEPQTWHLSEIGQVAASCLSLTQQLMGQEEAARTSLEESLGRFPDSVRLRRQLLNVLIKQGAAEAAMAEFNRLPSSLPMREALRCAVRGALLAGQRNWLAALPYLKTSYTAGCRDVICLRWFAVVLISTGDLAAARPVLLEWQRIEPQNAEIQAYLSATEPQVRPTTEVRFGEAPVSVHALDPTEAAKKIRFDSKQPDDAPQHGRFDRALPKMENAMLDLDLPDSPASV
jgi:tetratricopeptide (TPR) repeat protein